MTASTPPSAMARVLGSLPVVGYAARCLSEHLHGELGLLGVNLLMALALGLILLGYPFLITAALLLAAFVGLAILGSTIG
ncbi:MAG: hypothetical protein AB7F78_00945 [Hyphomicrobiaceae bacterium]